MMDLVSTCKGKLASFRVKELKDVLTELGLSKQGRKQDLVDRILAVLSDDQGMPAKQGAVGKEKVAKVVDDTYRKMQPSGAADLSKLHGVSDGKVITPKEEIGDSYKVDKICCPCGSSLPTYSTIMCEDTNCKVWQHIKCVVIPEKPQDGGQPNSPENFYCEICRLSRADPFWGAIAHPLYPVKLNITNIPTDGSNPGLGIEKTFQLTRADKDMLAKQEYDVQAWCMLLNDKPAFRIHWPQYADLQVNGVPVRTINRPGSQMLGTNGRDDGPIITPCTRDGINKISLTGCDARTFCVGVRIVKRRTLDEVLKKIPTEAEGEPFDDALARVRRCVGGGAAAENDDSDSDLEVVADNIPVNLRCPMSGLRMKVAGRFKPCAHMGCFDLEVFVEMNQRSRKWQCPICLKNYSLENVIIDPYFNRITSQLQNCEQDISEIEVKPDGSWRAKLEGSHKILSELGLWHLPDGTICTSMEVESKPKQEFEPVKQEPGSDSNGCLKLGIKKNQNGSWEFNKSADMRGVSPANRLNGQNTIPMSSSATGSGRDFVDVSVNQNGNGTENESICLNYNQSHGFNDNHVIVLSDSDEEIEIEPRVSPGTISPPEQQSRVVSDSCNENPGFINGGNPSIDLCSPNDEFAINTWSLPSTSQEGAGFQFLGSDTDGPIQCSMSVNGSTGVASATCIEDSELNGELVDNPLVLNGEDPSLQIFLPTRPPDGPGGQAGMMRERRDVLDVDGWISLKLADNGASNQGDPNGLNSIRDIPPKDSALDSLADIALRGMNSDVNSNRSVNGNGKTSREGAGSPFTFPRQRRSVKPRLYLSIDSD